MEPQLANQATKYFLNHPANCPWISSAPLQSITTMNPGKRQYMKQKARHGFGQENAGSVHPFASSTQNGTNLKDATDQFFNFLRLMQLFPNVHPATLHSVMTVCKNDFFVAVDKLLHAKKCKDLYNSKKQIPVQSSGISKVYQTPILTKNYFTCVKNPHVIKLNSKKLLSRNRYNKMMIEKQGTAAVLNCSDLQPVTLQCNVPIRPLSPVSPENLSSSSFLNTALDMLE